MGKRQNVLISGASVAGPALAYWLRRYGFGVTVVERAPGPRPGGQGIDIRGAGRTVVERMGLMEPIRARHTGVHGMAYVDDAGRHRAVMTQEAFGDSGGVIADIEILRGDLVDLLVAASGPEVEYRFDDTVTALTETPDGVEVSFERAAPQRFDLVVGADGMNSTTRRLAFPAGSCRIEDAGYHRAVFTAADALDLGGWELMYNMPAGNGGGGRAAMLYPAHGGARGMFFFAGEPVGYDRRDVAAQKRIVAERFAGAGWRVPDMLAAMRDADDFYFDRCGRVVLDSWSRGRVTLLGDACTAGSVGMGTSMALVGAYVLAGELAAADGDHRVAFPAYQEAMRGFVAANLKPLPGGVRGFLPSTERGIRIRNLMMRTMMRLPGRSLMTGGMDRAVNAITLRDYPQPAPR